MKPQALKAAVVVEAAAEAAQRWAAAGAEALAVGVAAVGAAAVPRLVGAVAEAAALPCAAEAVGQRSVAAAVVDRGWVPEPMDRESAAVADGDSMARAQAMAVAATGCGAGPAMAATCIGIIVIIGTTAISMAPCSALVSGVIPTTTATATTPPRAWSGGACVRRAAGVGHKSTSATIGGESDH